MFIDNQILTTMTEAKNQDVDTKKIIQKSIEKGGGGGGGTFPKEDVPMLCYLAGWSEESGAILLLETVSQL